MRRIPCSQLTEPSSWPAHLQEAGWAARRRLIAADGRGTQPHQLAVAALRAHVPAEIENVQ